jgi:hypothetical protein
MENSNNHPNTVFESQLFVKKNIFPALFRLNHSYWFRLILTEKEETTEIRYKIAVRFVKQLTESSVLISIDRIYGELYINDHLPELPVDILANATGMIFYPMAVEISTKMVWLGIQNHEQMLQRWEKREPVLRRYFKGEEVDRYLNLMGKNIAVKANLETIFEKDLFIQIYFRTLYAGYTSDSTIPIAFYLGDYGDIQYEVKTSEIREDGEGRRIITQTGIEIQKQQKQEPGLENRNTYTAKYVLDTKTNCIRDIEAEWIRESPDKRKIRVILFPLRQQLTTDGVIEQDKPEKKKSNGFFSRLFGN